MEAPPKINSANKTRRVAREVFSDRIMVLLILSLMISRKLLLDVFRCSRMRSNTTMVSCTEKPRMVSNAVIKRLSTSIHFHHVRKLKIPVVINISCARAIIAAMPYTQEGTGPLEVFRNAQVIKRTMATNTMMMAFIALLFSSAPTLGPMDSKLVSCVPGNAVFRFSRTFCRVSLSMGLSLSMYSFSSVGCTLTSPSSSVCKLLFTLSISGLCSEKLTRICVPPVKSMPSFSPHTAKETALNTARPMEIPMSNFSKRSILYIHLLLMNFFDPKKDLHMFFRQPNGNDSHKRSGYRYCRKHTHTNAQGERNGKSLNQAGGKSTENKTGD